MNPIFNQKKIQNKRVISLKLHKLENRKTMSLSESLTMTNTITEIKIGSFK